MNTTTAGESRLLIPADLIDASTAAGLLGLDKSTVTRRAAAGTLPVLAQLSCGIYVFDASEITAVAAV